MSELTSILVATLAGGLLSVCLAALIAFRMSDRMTHQLVAFAAGVMLSAACLDILPEALEGFTQRNQANESAFLANRLFMTLLAGFLLFFSLERLAIWRHALPSTTHQDQLVDPRKHSAALLVLIGDGFHNFVDGILIAAAFLTNPILGWGTTMAIIAHEIPQELGDFVILRNAGWKKTSALLANAISSLTAVLGGILGYCFLQSSQVAIPYVLTLAAASFIYIAVADLLPMLHRQRGGNFPLQAGGLLCGIAVVPLMAHVLQLH